MLISGPRSEREGSLLGTEDIVKESSVTFTFSSLDREDPNNSNVMFSEVNFQSENSVFNLDKKYVVHSVSPNF